MLPALPLDEAGTYVAAAYLVFVALILIYVVIMASKLSRIEREVVELAELAELAERKDADAHAPSPAARAKEPVR